MTDYRDEIIDHYKNPRNFGELSNADVTLDESNSSCGDMIQIQVKTQELKKSKTQDGKKDLVIEEMKWRGVGCAISTAAASMLSEKIVGMTKKDLEKFGEGGVVEMLGGEINLGRMKCATLAYRGLLKVFEQKK